MRTTPALLRAAPFVWFLSASSACGSTEGTGGAGGTSSTTSSATGPGSTTSTAATTVASVGVSASSSSGPLASCDMAGLTECFSSYECGTADRCEDRGAPDAPVPCCSPGPRGAGRAGDPCAGEDDCYSSLCFELGAGGESYCTDSCDTPAQCPMPFSGCGPIAGSGSSLQFCLP